MTFSLHFREASMKHRCWNGRAALQKKKKGLTADAGR
jgi:hypothetical protein